MTAYRRHLKKKQKNNEVEASCRLIFLYNKLQVTFHFIPIYRNWYFLFYVQSYYFFLCTVVKMYPILYTECWVIWNSSMVTCFEFSSACLQNTRFDIMFLSSMTLKIFKLINFFFIFSKYFYYILMFVLFKFYSFEIYFEKIVFNKNSNPRIVRLYHV